MALVAGSVLLLVPMGGTGIGSQIRAVTGDFSVTTLVAVTALWLGRYDGAPWFRRFSIVTALALYPMALGLGPLDPYALGYSPRILPLGFLVLSVVSWWRGVGLLAIAIGMAQLAFALNLYESDNLWDYVIDPWLVIAFAVGAFRARTPTTSE
jgi:hypothetical protein